MPSSKYNISGITTVVLSRPGESLGIQSISIANTHATNSVLIDLYIGTISSDGDPAISCYLMKGKILHKGDYIILDHRNLRFNVDFGLFISLNESTSTVDVLIN